MKSLLGLTGLFALCSTLHAADLAAVYRAAQDQDPNFAVARANRDAGIEKKPQALAGLLPSLTLSGNTVWNRNEVESRAGTFANAQPKFNSNGYTLALTQPLFRWQNWVGYEQGRLQAAQAEATLAQARQDLILRVAQAYFDVVYANESLAAVRANKAAIAQQLEAAKKNFEVGTTTITDTHEAQARFDLALAQEIAAESDLQVKRHALRAIVGDDPGPLAAPRPGVSLSAPQPADINQWVDTAEKGAFAVQLQQLAADVAEREVARQRAGHYPTVDLVANAGNSTTLASTTIGMVDTDFRNVGVQVNVPLFQGGLTVSRQREAAANRQAAVSGLEAARRNAALSARQYYLGVVNGLAQVGALKAAMVSSQSALESNKLGYEVGVRINIDVLNAENQLYVTRRDLARATLDTLMAQLRLKAATGALGDEDVEAINALLDPASAE